MIIVNTFFYFKSRLYISTYIIDPLSVEDIQTQYKGHAYEINNIFSEYDIQDPFDISQFLLLSEQIFSNIVRFLQNNKSYKYVYEKKYKLSDKEKNKLFKVVNNISLEGAYFLNPRYLNKVKLKLYYNDEKDEEILFKYFKFIIEQELKAQERKHSFSLSPSTTNKMSEVSKNLIKLHNFTEFVLFGLDSYEKHIFENLVTLYGRQDAESLSNIYGNFDLTLRKELSLFIYVLQVREIINRFASGKNFYEDEIVKLKYYLNQLFKEMELKHKVKLNYYFYNHFNDFKVLIETESFYKDFSLAWKYNLASDIKFGSFVFNDDNFNFEEIIDDYVKGIKVVDKSFNTTEFLSINIFSIVFSLIVYFIIGNLRRKQIL